MQGAVLSTEEAAVHRADKAPDLTELTFQRERGRQISKHLMGQGDFRQ